MEAPTEKPKTATCWSGSGIYCKACKGPTRDGEDEYGGLSGGGDYERFICLNPACGVTTYIEMPD